MAKFLSFKPITMKQLACNLQGYAQQAGITIPQDEYLGMFSNGDQLIAATKADGTGFTVATGDPQTLDRLHERLMTPYSFSRSNPKGFSSPQQLAKRQKRLKQHQSNSKR